jgi:hypothetical protein
LKKYTKRKFSIKLYSGYEKTFIDYDE